MLRALLGFVGTAACAALMLVAAPAQAASGYVHDLSGQVSVTDRAGASKPLHIGDLIDSGSTIRTEAGAGATVKFEDGQVMVLREKTAFRIADYSYDKKNIGASRAVFNLLRGGMRFITGVIGATNHNSFKLTAGNMTIGIRGSDGDTSYDDVTKAVTVAVNAGALVMNTQFGSQLIGANFFSVFLGTSAPVLALTSQAPPAVKAAVEKSLNQANVPVNTPVVVALSAKAAVAAAQSRLADALAAATARAAAEAKAKADAAKGTAEAEKLEREAAQIKAIADREAQVAKDADSQAKETLGAAVDAAKAAFDAAKANGAATPQGAASGNSDPTKGLPASGAGNPQGQGTQGQGTSGTPGASGSGGAGGSGGGGGGGGVASPS